jgi:hypothetical protein
VRDAAHALRVGQCLLYLRTHPAHFRMLQNVGHPFIGKPHGMTETILDDFHF